MEGPGALAAFASQRVRQSKRGSGAGRGVALFRRGEAARAGNGGQARGPGRGRYGRRPRHAEAAHTSGHDRRARVPPPRRRAGVAAVESGLSRGPPCFVSSVGSHTGRLPALLPQEARRDPAPRGGEGARHRRRYRRRFSALPADRARAGVSLEVPPRARCGRRAGGGDGSRQRFPGPPAGLPDAGPADCFRVLDRRRSPDRPDCAPVRHRDGVRPLFGRPAGMGACAPGRVSPRRVREGRRGGHRPRRPDAPGRLRRGAVRGRFLVRPFASGISGDGVSRARGAVGRCPEHDRRRRGRGRPRPRPPASFFPEAARPVARRPDGPGLRDPDLVPFPGRVPGVDRDSHSRGRLPRGDDLFSLGGPHRRVGPLRSLRVRRPRGRGPALTARGAGSGGRGDRRGARADRGYSAPRRPPAGARATPGAGSGTGERVVIRRAVLGALLVALPLCAAEAPAADPCAAAVRENVRSYAHYDGQPVGAAQWPGDPREPVLRDKPLEEGGREISQESARLPINPEWRIYARSASDDKAPIVALLAALDAMRAGSLALSVNVKFFLEGEEEAGSPHLPRFLETYAARLKADLWLLFDGPVHQTRRMQIYFGARGVTDIEITTYGPVRRLHSGHYGNWAPNPIVELARLVSGLRSAAVFPSISLWTT